MQRIETILILLLLLSCLNCKQKSIARQDCDNEKAFISLDTYLKIQATQKNDIPLYPTNELLPAICFDSFTSFSQIDTLEAFYCKNKLEPYGVFPLKYVYNKDTILLSAFPFACDYFPDRGSRIIFVTLTDKNINFDIGNSIIGINDSRLKDSLSYVFTKAFKRYFERQYEIIEKVKDTVEAREILKSVHSHDAFVFNIEIQKDGLIKNLKTPIDIVLTMYLAALQDCIKKYYKKEICELTPFELKLFSGNFFLNFEIHKIQ
jgi:hypothetical protein